MNALSLCSGIGALDLAIQTTGVQTIGYCEYDPWCCEVLQHRMATGHLDSAPIWRDLNSLDGYSIPVGVDLIYGGIPCQPHSQAGKRLQSGDSRDLWPATRRLLSEVRPRLFFLENVAGFTTRNGDTPAFAYSVIADLASLGYVGRAGVVKASDAGAPHSRARWFCLATLAHEGNLADSRYNGSSKQQFKQSERTKIINGSSNDGLADAGREQVNVRRLRTRAEYTASSSTVGDAEQQPPWTWEQEQMGREERAAGPGRWKGSNTRPSGASQFPPSRLDSAAWAAILQQHPEYAPALVPGFRVLVDGRALFLDQDRRRQLAALGNAVVPAQVLLALEHLL